MSCFAMPHARHRLRDAGDKYLIDAIVIHVHDFELPFTVAKFFCPLWNLAHVGYHEAAHRVVKPLCLFTDPDESKFVLQLIDRQ